ncbi:MAG: hypothetical protein RL648_1799 [Verrucomicrobiota bacterium]
MKLTILYFARLKEAAGTDFQSLETACSTVEELYAALAREQQFGLPFDQIRAAVNETFCDGSTLLKDGDVVAFMPPMSGG